MLTAFTWIAPLILIFTSIVELRKNHGSDIRVIWYLFSLSAIVTVGIALWGIQHQAIDPNGRFIGAHGTTLGRILEFVCDLNADIDFLLSVAGLIILPQLASYFLSGISGNATAPLFMNRTASFLTWGVIKSFAVIGGVMSGLILIAYSRSWQSTIWNHPDQVATVMLLPTAASFFLLSAYRQTQFALRFLIRHFPKRLKRALMSIHNFLTRSERR